MHPGHSSLCIIKTMLGGVHVVDAFFLIALRCLDPVFLFFLFLGGGGVPSYFEALWYPHLYFYRKSNA